MEQTQQPIITVDFDMFDKTPEEKTALANSIARSFGVDDEALSKVEEYKAELTKHNAWDLPFMGYLNEDGYGYAYVPDAAITTNPLLGCPCRLPGPAEERAEGLRHPHAVHPPSRGPLWRGHVPALPVRHHHQVRWHRSQQILIPTGPYAMGRG